MLTIPEAAAALKVSARTIRREIAGGRLNACLVDGELLVSDDDLASYIESCKVVAKTREIVRKPTKAQQLVAKGPLLPANQVLAAARPLQLACGVYFLVSADRIVYVGQSTNIYSRVEQHRVDGKEFDSWCFVRAPAEQLNDLERQYILAFAPSLNVNVPDVVPCTLSELEQAVALLPTLEPPAAPHVDQ